MNIQEIKELLEAFDRSDAISFDMETGDIKLKINKAGAVSADYKRSDTAMSDVQMKTAEVLKSEEVQAQEAQIKESQAKEREVSDDTTTVKAPLAGIFYRSASLEATPYVIVGQEVKKGDVIGLIEAMKVMNEIPAPCDGVVRSILVESETFVGYDEVLVEID